MNSQPNLPQNINLTDETETDHTLSIDEFFRQLEAKERDLDMSVEMVIEIDETNVAEPSPAAIPPIQKVAEPEKSIAPAAAPVIAAAPDKAETTDTAAQSAEIVELQNRIARMEAERVHLIEAARRRQNDFDSFKSRTERERGETFRNQASSLAKQMLPVVDNLNRALNASNPADDQPKDFQQFFQGIALVSRQLDEILSEMGVTAICAVGEQFDPHFHEAVATEATDEHPAQTVTAEFLRGYCLGDKVIRPSMVKVSTKGEVRGEK